MRNRAKEHKTHSRFRDVGIKDKPGVNYVSEDSSGEEGVVCVAEW
jgi:hypothetical protein